MIRRIHPAAVLNSFILMFVAFLAFKGLHNWPDPSYKESGIKTLHFEALSPIIFLEVHRRHARLQRGWLGGEAGGSFRFSHRS